jgi:hypothetical protein
LKGGKGEVEMKILSRNQIAEIKSTIHPRSAFQMIDDLVNIALQAQLDQDKADCVKEIEQTKKDVYERVRTILCNYAEMVKLKHNETEYFLLGKSIEDWIKEIQNVEIKSH